MDPDSVSQLNICKALVKTESGPRNYYGRVSGRCREENLLHQFLKHPESCFKKGEFNGLSSTRTSAPKIVKGLAFQTHAKSWPAKGSLRFSSKEKKKRTQDYYVVPAKNISLSPTPLPSYRPQDYSLPALYKRNFCINGRNLKNDDGRGHTRSKSSRNSDRRQVCCTNTKEPCSELKLPPCRKKKRNFSTTTNTTTHVSSSKYLEVNLPSLSTGDQDEVMGEYHASVNKYIVSKQAADVPEILSQILNKTRKLNTASVELATVYHLLSKGCFCKAEKMSRFTSSKKEQAQEAIRSYYNRKDDHKNHSKILIIHLPNPNFSPESESLRTTPKLFLRCAKFNAIMKCIALT